MRQKYVMGNWKMNGSVEQIKPLLYALIEDYPSDTQARCAVFPPSIYIPLVKELLSSTPISWGAQNTFMKDSGAFTGEISALMLKDYACQYVLVGHSERRQIFAEDEKFITEKFHHVKDHDMIPVLCVGETLIEREKGQTQEVLAQQIRAVASKNKDTYKQCIIAYEPVWAIGTGVTATPEQAQATHAFIRELIAEYDAVDAQTVPILYGGSVNQDNAHALFAMPDIDGGLVGGASLNASQFLEILECIN